MAFGEQLHPRLERLQSQLQISESAINEGRRALTGRRVALKTKELVERLNPIVVDGAIWAGAALTDAVRQSIRFDGVCQGPIGVKPERNLAAAKPPCVKGEFRGSAMAAYAGAAFCREVKKKSPPETGGDICSSNSLARAAHCYFFFLAGAFFAAFFAAFLVAFFIVAILPKRKFAIFYKTAV